MYTDLAIYDFIWPVYGEVTLLLSEEVTDLPTWGDFKHLIIENKVSHINIQWGELNFAAGFLSERDSAWTTYHSSEQDYQTNFKSKPSLWDWLIAGRGCRY